MANGPGFLPRSFAPSSKLAFFNCPAIEVYAYINVLGNQYVCHLCLAGWPTPLNGGTSGAESGKRWTARLLAPPSEEQLCTLQTISVARRSGSPAYCCRLGSQRGPSGWYCRIFSYPLHFLVSVSHSPSSSVLLEGGWGRDSRQHLRLTAVRCHLTSSFEVLEDGCSVSFGSNISAGHRQWSSDKMFIILALKLWM